jgi:hypothetical protein
LGGRNQINEKFDYGEEIYLNRKDVREALHIPDFLGEFE